MVWLLIRIVGMVLFEWYAKVHGKTVRQGRQTLKDLALPRRCLRGRVGVEPDDGRRGS